MYSEDRAIARHLPPTVVSSQPSNPKWYSMHSVQAVMTIDDPLPSVLRTYSMLAGGPWLSRRHLVRWLSRMEKIVIHES